MQLCLDFLLTLLKPSRYMFYNIRRPSKPYERVFVNGKALKEVSNFKYLGSNIATTSRDISARKGRCLESTAESWCFFGSLKCQGNQYKDIPNCSWTCSSVWSWKMGSQKKSDIRTLDGFYTRVLRRVFGISWKSHTPNFVLYSPVIFHR